MSAPHPTNALRIGDAERERAAADLGEHYAQGRLSADEHAERLEQVWAARTAADLVPVFHDLPGGAYGARPVDPPGRRPAPRWRGRRFLPVPLFAIIGLVVLVVVVTHLPLILIGLLAFWCLSRGPWRGAHHGPHHGRFQGCR
jgi:hypothetical protein